jgi:hypothetical protein
MAAHLPTKGYHKTSSADKPPKAMRTMLAESRIRPIKIEPDVRVHTAWDLGVADSTAIWFIQCVGRERRLVDYYEGSGVGLGHYAQVLHDKRIQHGWKYGDHYFPHDIKIREFSSGQSRLQSLARSVLRRLPCHNPMFWMALMLLVACSDALGSMAIGVSEALKRYVSIVVSMMIG